MKHLCAKCHKNEATKTSKEVGYGLLILCDKCANEENNISIDDLKNLFGMND